MKQTILITGASGLVGRHLVRKLKLNHFEIKTLTTNRERANGKDTFFWNPEQQIIDNQSVEDVDFIIHLAGANIGESRWTEERKKTILESRTISAALLLKAVEEKGTQLKAFISSSATGYYGAITTSEVMNEDSKPAGDFLGSVCVAWEQAADLFTVKDIRTVKIRTGVVLAKNAPALNKMLLLVKFGIGSPLGSGKQYMPWIHIDDLCEIYLKAVLNENMQGPYNAVAPHQTDNKTMMKTLAKQLKRPFFFPAVPAFVLKFLLGEMSSLVLEGSMVSPLRLIESGFRFKYPDIDEALKEILQ